MKGDGSCDNAKARCQSLFSFIYLTYVTCPGQSRPVGTGAPRDSRSKVFHIRGSLGLLGLGVQLSCGWTCGCCGPCGHAVHTQDDLRPAGSRVERNVTSGLNSPRRAGPTTGCPRGELVERRCLPRGSAPSSHWRPICVGGGWSAPELREVVDKAPRGPLNHQAQPPRGVEGLQGSGLRHSCQGRTRPPLRARGRVPRGWQAACGCSGSCSWLPASHMDLHTAPRMTTGRPRSPAVFLQLDRTQERPVSRCVSCTRTAPRGHHKDRGFISMP